MGEPDSWQRGIIFGSQVSAIGYGSSGSGTGTGPNLYLVLNTRTRDLTAETWDLRMKPRSPVSL
jgi:hypothetical protein